MRNRALAEALAADLQPLRTRLAAVLQIEDPALQRAKLVAILEDYETIKRDLLADPEAARVLEAEMASAMSAGFTAPRNPA